MAITQKQKAAMAVILLAGLLAGGAALMKDRSAAHADHDGHGHDTRPAPARPGASTAAPAQEASHQHGKEGGHAEDHAHADAAASARSVHLSASQIATAGITVQPAGPGRLQSAVAFQGELRFNEDRTAHVVPRLGGVVEQVPAVLGQQVRQGQVLAVITSTALSEQRSELLTAERRLESARATYEREKKLWADRISAEQDLQQARTAWQEADIAVQNARQKLAAVGAAGAGKGALNRFEVRAPFDGTLVEKHIALGEAVKEDSSIFTLSDLRTIWAEFNVAPKDLEAVRVGQRVIVTSTASQSRVEGSVSYVGALLGEQTRTAKARVTLTNPQGAWRPGLFVTVSVLGPETEAPLTVAAEAVQTLNQDTVVFRATPEGFDLVPVRLGRSDGRRTEVLSGLKSGDPVAVANAFVLKSELGKGEAGHAH
ncbi:efflux RND transporter periplasmic adaptor subunit [Roseateles sp. SL47]|uniref:efflux RND transporter periplasmic adaptor subunit n=1 Tax=Roseateles sp. SL47 TaxID=2995138 RepID=UPI00226D83E0|nr:efflux RND transporter periplasmic adaptor subunit [Roseateles sp. SL47]WAC71514.1 efflux RND transporter periplasmic adaptor subunit [Roseateles sp. SL47]